nr:unnamed protein product [Callosobruchus chinensis]
MQDSSKGSVLKKASQLTNVSYKTLYKIIRTGVKTRKKRSNFGKFKNLNPTTADKIRNIVYDCYKKRQIPTAEIAHRTLLEKGENSSRRTLQRWLRKIGFRFGTIDKKDAIMESRQAANRRKDSISEKFLKLYDPNSTEPEFSWHQDCLATYISEEKIRRREIALHKQEEVSASTSKANVEKLAPKPRSSSRTPAALKKSLKCIFCKKVTRNKDQKLHLCSEIAAAEKNFSTARRKEDHVFTELSTYQRPADLFAIEVRYHKHCYLDYLRLPRRSEMPAGRPSNQIPKEILMDAFDKLMDEIKDQLPTHSFEVRFLAQRLAVLTNIEGALIENRVVKSLLIDKFGENLLFSYPADRSKSSLAFMGNIPLTEIIEHVRNINSKNIIIETAKALRQELL